ncbi:MAG: 50S ribosomal protein L6 [Anaerolineaceae bacterium]|nr:50S ribosomal protein L6 [Anaerolineaceae bacterium]
MSRIGRMPVAVPAGVKVDILGSQVKVKGPNGELARVFSPSIAISMENGEILVQRNSDAPTQRALHGTTRALLFNMVTGVSAGFTKTLEIDGVGYRAEMNGKNLILHVGFSHPVEMEPPDGITFEVDTKTRQVRVKGHDRELIGQVAANIRKVRPPEPYKGKGIHYLGEHIRRKAGKSGKAAKK